MYSCVDLRRPSMVGTRTYLVQQFWHIPFNLKGTPKISIEKNDQNFELENDSTFFLDQKKPWNIKVLATGPKPGYLP